jgi:Pentapeptide repeats (8 copies)
MADEEHVILLRRGLEVWKAWWKAHVDRRLGSGGDKSPSGIQEHHMADEEHIILLRRGVEVWNAWRKAHPDVVPNLNGFDLPHANLHGANLRDANLIEARLVGHLPRDRPFFRQNSMIN